MSNIKAQEISSYTKNNAVGVTPYEVLIIVDIGAAVSSFGSL